MAIAVYGGGVTPEVASRAAGPSSILGSAIPKNVK